MQENDDIKDILKRRNHSLSHEIQFWTFFKSKILEKEENRIIFDQKRLTSEEFKSLLRKTVNPCAYGPKFCRGANQYHKKNALALIRRCYEYYTAILSPDSPIQVKNTIHGLGIFSHIKSSFSDKLIYPEELSGSLVELSKEDFEELKSKDFPCLYEGNRIMIGPLSLCNHECKKNVGFKPYKESVFAKAFGRVTLKEGDEITVDYYNTEKIREVTFNGRKCACRRCTKCM